MKKETRKAIESGRCSVVNEKGKFIIDRAGKEIADDILTGKRNAQKIDYIKEDNWAIIYVEVGI